MMRKNKTPDWGIDIFDGMDNAPPTTFQNVRRWLGMRALAVATVGVIGGSATAIYAMYEKSPEISNDVTDYIERHASIPSSTVTPSPEITDSITPASPYASASTTTTP